MPNCLKQLFYSLHENRNYYLWGIKSPPMYSMLQKIKERLTINARLHRKGFPRDLIDEIVKICGSRGLQQFAFAQSNEIFARFTMCI